MPTNKESEVLHYLKAISMFDTETDFGNEDAKRQLSLLFRELIMSDDPQAKEFFSRFLGGVDKVIKDMGLIDSAEGEDVVDMPPPEEKEPVADVPAGPTSGPGAPKPQAPMADSYNYLLDRANSFIYM